MIKQWVYRGPEGSSGETAVNLPTENIICKEEPSSKYDMDPLAKEPEVMVKEEFVPSLDTSQSQQEVGNCQIDPIEMN